MNKRTTYECNPQEMLPQPTGQPIEEVCRPMGLSSSSQIVWLLQANLANRYATYFASGTLLLPAPFMYSLMQSPCTAFDFGIESYRAITCACYCTMCCKPLILQMWLGSVPRHNGHLCKALLTLIIQVIPVVLQGLYTFRQSIVPQGQPALAWTGQALWLVTIKALSLNFQSASCIYRAREAI